MDANNEPADTPKDGSDTNRPSHSEDGVDLTLIRWMLSLTPAERLEVLRQHSQAIEELRNANPHL